MFFPKGTPSSGGARTEPLGAAPSGHPEPCSRPHDALTTSHRDSFCFSPGSLGPLLTGSSVSVTSVLTSGLGKEEAVFSRPNKFTITDGHQRPGPQRALALVAPVSALPSSINNSCVQLPLSHSANNRACDSKSQLAACPPMSCQRSEMGTAPLGPPCAQNTH